MKYIGAHVSAQGGVENAPVNANRDIILRLEKDLQIHLNISMRLLDLNTLRECT